MSLEVERPWGQFFSNVFCKMATMLGDPIVEIFNNAVVEFKGLIPPNAMQIRPIGRVIFLSPHFALIHSL